MSDMQTDGNNPTKFTEIINDGIIDYVQNNYGGNTNETLDMILIPGDLVSTGTNYSDWKDEFFAQSEPLFSTVPFYPVLGNHEANANLYFQYIFFLTMIFFSIKPYSTVITIIFSWMILNNSKFCF